MKTKLFCLWDEVEEQLTDFDFIDKSRNCYNFQKSRFVSTAVM